MSDGIDEIEARLARLRAATEDVGPRPGFADRVAREVAAAPAVAVEAKVRRLPGWRPAAWGALAIAAAITLFIAWRGPQKDRPIVVDVASAGGADASTREAARAHYQRGTTAYNEGRYRLAVQELTAANEIEPNYKVLYTIAQADIQVEDWEGAIAALEGYLQQGKDDIPEARRRQIEKDIASLRSRRKP